MHILKKIEFDRHCCETTVMIVLLGAALTFSTFVARGAEIYISAREFAVMVGDICACSILTLYFNMLAYAVSNAMSDEEYDGLREYAVRSASVFHILNGAALFLKILWLVLSFLLLERAMLPVHGAALAVDTLLSRRCALGFYEKSMFNTVFSMPQFDSVFLL